MIAAHADHVGSLLRQVVGNRVSVADEERKLTTIARTARRAWPDG